VLDLNMPVLDGITMLHRLAELPLARRPHVIVLTAHGSFPLAVRAVRLGAMDFLQKPVTPDDLRLSVAAVLAEPRVSGAADDASVGPPLPRDELFVQVRRDLARHDLSHAEQMLNQVAERAGDDPAYFNLLGVLHEAEGDRRAAKTFYRKAAAARGEVGEPARHNLRRLHELETYGETRMDVALGDEQDLLSGLRGGLGSNHLDRVRRILGR
jgi:DNA-binding response OmpR family regulator